MAGLIPLSFLHQSSIIYASPKGFQGANDLFKPSIMLNKTSRQNLILPLCVCIFVLLSSLFKFWTPLLTQMNDAGAVVFCLNEQGDLDDSIFQSCGINVLPPQPERLPTFQTSGYCHATLGLQFARGPPLFS